MEKEETTGKAKLARRFRQLLAVLLPGLFMLAISLIGVRLSTEVRDDQEALRNRQQQLLNMVDSSRSAQLFFENQQLSWRSMRDPTIETDEFMHHLREYESANNLVNRQLEILRETLTVLKLDSNLTDKITSQHIRLYNQHMLAVEEYDPDDKESWLPTVDSSRGLEQLLSSRLGTLIGTVVFEATKKISEQNESSEASWKRTRDMLFWLTAVGVAFTSWIAWLIQISNTRLESTLGTLKYAQEELVRSEKLAALGALVAGVSHELNTPLGNSVTVASSLKHWIKDLDAKSAEGSIKRSDLSNFCDEAQKGCELLEVSLRRSVDIVGHFKQVAVDQSSGRLKNFDLSVVIHELAESLEPNFNNTHHQLEVIVPKSIYMEGYPTALNQVLTNLVLNALNHAFEHQDKGLVKLTVSNLNSDWVRIEVTDNGSGIPKDLQSKIFDPFFTTKMGSGGNGLGLYIVHNIATGVLGGRLWLDDLDRIGTTFILEIPKVVSAEQSFSTESL